MMLWLSSLAIFVAHAQSADAVDGARGLAWGSPPTEDMDCRPVEATRWACTRPDDTAPLGAMLPCRFVGCARARAVRHLVPERVTYEYRVTREGGATLIGVTAWLPADTYSSLHRAMLRAYGEADWGRADARCGPPGLGHMSLWRGEGVEATLWCWAKAPQRVAIPAEPSVVSVGYALSQ
jgi:hypothetical protein